MPVSLAAVLLAALGAATEPPAPASRPTGAGPAAASEAAVDTSPLVHEGIVNAPPEEVWKVWSTAEGFKAFGVAQVRMDFRVGGLIESHYDPKGTLGDEGTIVNQIIGYDPGRVMMWRIHQPPKGFPFKEAWKGTWSVATMTDLGGGRTHLRLAGCGYTADPEAQAMRKFFQSGNAWSMQKLQSHFDKAVRPASPGAAHAESPLAPIEVAVTIAAPREEVFRAFATSAGWKAFFGVESRIGSAPGGPFEIEFSQEPPAGTRGSEGCKVLSLSPGEMISYEWNAPPNQPFARQHKTWVVVTFEAVNANATRVRLRHMGFAERAAEFADHAKEFETCRGYFSQAWPRVLEKLKGHFEPKNEAAKAGA